MSDMARNIKILTAQVHPLVLKKVTYSYPSFYLKLTTRKWIIAFKRFVGTRWQSKKTG